MAIPKTVIGEVIDELDGEEVEASIGDARWVMSTLAGLYSSSTLAVIREYSTNARDAQVEAGRGNVPIEVTLPSNLNPEFIVKDTGIGMSTEEMRKTYLSFGNSTKRDSNAYNGMLGFGSKSAVAYTTSFSVTSTKNGITTYAAVSKRPDSSIFMKILGVTKDDAPNGTTIRIPVHNVGEFRQVADDFYKFWLPGRVLVEGREPARAVGEKLAEGMFISNNHESYVVMGNVPYRITNSAALFQNRKIAQFNFVLYVENGEVEFTPAREALEYSELTRNTLHKYIGEFEASVIAKAQKDIDGAKTKWEARDRYRKWSSSIGTGVLNSLTFKGESFVSQVTLNPAPLQLMPYTLARRCWSFYLSDSHKDLYVTGCRLKRIGSVQGERVRRYFDSQGIHTGVHDGDIYFFEQDTNVSDWINPNRIASWDEIVKATRPKYGSSGNQVRRTEHYRMIFWDPNYKTWVDQTDIDLSIYKDENLVWITAGDAQDLTTPKRRGTLAQFMRYMDDKDKAIVIVAKPRVAKFQKNHPKVSHLKDWARANIVTDINTFYSKDERLANSVPADTRNWLSRFDLSKIDDPAVHALAKVVAAKPTSKPEADRHTAMAKFMSLPVKGIEKVDVESISKMYPLLANMYYSKGMINEVYLYMNGRYRAMKKEDKK